MTCSARFLDIRALLYVKLRSMPDLAARRDTLYRAAYASMLDWAIP